MFFENVWVWLETERFPKINLSKLCSLRLTKMTVAAYINSECVLKVNNYGILPQPPEC